jgi:GT2 family glycosyltransferase
MNLKKVFIVLLNHNAHIHTIECLETVYKMDYQNVQILLVDNSISTTSVNCILDWCRGKKILESTQFPDLVSPHITKPIQYKYLEEAEVDEKDNYQEKLIIIKAAQNKGFASGNNIALKYIQSQKGDYFIWLLNNDTVVKKDSLTQLVNYYNKTGDDKVGIIGSKLRYYYAPSTINGIGGVYKNLTGVASHLGESEIDKGQYDKYDYGSKIDYVIGASMFLPRNFLLDVGLLNEEYFLFFEELDWAYRGRSKGWTLGFEPQSLIYHKESASISPEKNKSLLFETSFLASRVIFCRKFNKAALPFIYIMLIPTLINRIRRKQGSRLLPLINAAFSPVSFNKKIIKNLNRQE